MKNATCVSLTVMLLAGILFLIFPGGTLSVAVRILGIGLLLSGVISAGNEIAKKVDKSDIKQIGFLVKINGAWSEIAIYTVLLRYNGVGFNGHDAKVLSDMAQLSLRGVRLSDRQMRLIKARIGKYAGQLVNLSISKGLIRKEGKNYVW